MRLGPICSSSKPWPTCLRRRPPFLLRRKTADLPIFATMTFGEDGRTFLGTSPQIAAIVLSSLGVDVLGVNCSLGPRRLAPYGKPKCSSASHGSRYGAGRMLACRVSSMAKRVFYDVAPDEYIASRGGTWSTKACRVAGWLLRHESRRISRKRRRSWRAARPSSATWLPRAALRRASHATLLARPRRCHHWRAHQPYGQKEASRPRFARAISTMCWVKPFPRRNRAPTRST